MDQISGRLEKGRTEPSSISILSSATINGNYSNSKLSTTTTTTRKRSRWFLLIIGALCLIVVSLVLVGLVVHLRTTKQSIIHPQPTEAMSRVCSKTRYQSLCLNSLLNFPGSMTASEKDMVHISVNMTLQGVVKLAFFTSSNHQILIETAAGGGGGRSSAYQDCLELLDDSVYHLSRSLTPDGSQVQDVMTWLSAAMTNVDTCMDGLSEVESGNYVKGLLQLKMDEKLKELSEMVSNCLAIYSDGVPLQHRRLMSSSSSFPEWLSRNERRLLQSPTAGIQADIVVAKDGSGTCKTISEAIKRVPEFSNRRIIIYLKAGRYEEDNLKVGRKKTNVMFIGDGKGKTVITGGVNRVVNDVTTFHTASFAATGAGFIARDITFENYAGPSKHQAVALRIGADHAVIYQCDIIGYQDTLYVHSQRQFYRECDIYGTVDFIFGNAAVVFQKCNIYARKPMPLQKITITAQNRKDPNQNTGISIHACRILAQPDLEASKASFPTYLGRPWKLYSRTVYMQSYMGDHIHPKGWLEWSGSFALDTLYYGEYMNNGPGSAVGGRVNWPGYRVIKTTVEANRFTVGQFIYGSSWIPSTGVAFLAGLS